MINQCYPAIFYSEFPIKTLTQINLIYKQLLDRCQKQKLQKVGYKHYKTCQFTYLLYVAMQQIRSAISEYFDIDRALCDHGQGYSGNKDDKAQTRKMFRKLKQTEFVYIESINPIYEYCHARVIWDFVLNEHSYFRGVCLYLNFGNIVGCSNLVCIVNYFIRQSRFIISENNIIPNYICE